MSLFVNVTLLLSRGCTSNMNRCNTQLTNVSRNIHDSQSTGERFLASSNGVIFIETVYNGHLPPLDAGRDSLKLVGIGTASSVDFYGDVHTVR